MNPNPKMGPRRLILATILFLPMAIFVTFTAQNFIAQGKQITFNRARESLQAALAEFPAGNPSLAKRYQYFQVNGRTNVPGTANVLKINGATYSPAFATAEEYQFRNQGVLAITTNGDLLWLDYRRGPKRIESDYQVPLWRRGF